jgi:hypothetical protein
VAGDLRGASLPVVARASRGTPIRRATTTATASGTTISSTFTCGATGSVQQSYTASGNQLVTYNPRSGGVEIEVRTLQ